MTLQVNLPCASAKPNVWGAFRSAVNCLVRAVATLYRLGKSVHLKSSCFQGIVFSFLSDFDIAFN